MRRRLKVCVLGGRGVPGVSGGVEAHCEALYPLLARDAGLDIVLLARKNYVSSADYMFNGVRVIALAAPRHAHFEAIAHTVVGVLTARFVQRAHIVHVHGIGPALAAPLARLLGMKVIVTHHSRNYLHQKWNKLSQAVLRLGEWCAATFANHVIAVSPSMAAELTSRYPRAKAISYIPNGAPDFGDPPTVEEQQATLDRFGLSAGGYILGVGRITPEKGFHDLVAAFERSGSTASLVIAGKADFENAYSQGLMARASDRIIFAGHQDRRTLQSLYANAGLFVLASHHEGMPIAALEAITFGAPILLSDIEANCDLGLPQRHYFPAGDIEALSVRLSGDFADFRFDGGAMISAYQWAEIAERTAAIYAELAIKLQARSGMTFAPVE